MCFCAVRADWCSILQTVQACATWQQAGSWKSDGFKNFLPILKSFHSLSSTNYDYPCLSSFIFLPLIYLSFSCLFWFLSSALLLPFPFCFLHFSFRAAFSLLLSCFLLLIGRNTNLRPQHSCVFFIYIFLLFLYIFTYKQITSSHFYIPIVRVKIMALIKPPSFLQNLRH